MTYVDAPVTYGLLRRAGRRSAASLFLVSASAVPCGAVSVLWKMLSAIGFLTEIVCEAPQNTGSVTVSLSIDAEPLVRCWLLYSMKR